MFTFGLYLHKYSAFREPQLDSVYNLLYEFTASVKKLSHIKLRFCNYANNNVVSQNEDIKINPMYSQIEKKTLFLN